MSWLPHSHWISLFLSLSFYRFAFFLSFFRQSLWPFAIIRLPTILHHFGTQWHRCHSAIAIFTAYKWKKRLTNLFWFDGSRPLTYSYSYRCSLSKMEWNWNWNGMGLDAKARKKTQTEAMRCRKTIVKPYSQTYYVTRVITNSTNMIWNPVSHIHRL